MTRAMVRTVPALGVLAAFAIAVAILVRPEPPRPRVMGTPDSTALARLRHRIGSEAPELTFRLLADDSEHRLTEFRGRRVLINVWASGCGPCWKEMPKLVDLQELHGNRLAVVTLTTSFRNRVRELVAKRNVVLPILSGYPLRQTWERTDVGSLRTYIDGWIPNVVWPLAILIDPDGKIAAFRYGSDGIEELISAIPL